MRAGLLTGLLMNAEVSMVATRAMVCGKRLAADVSSAVADNRLISVASKCSVRSAVGPRASAKNLRSFAYGQPRAQSLDDLPGIKIKCAEGDTTGGLVGMGLVGRVVEGETADGLGGMGLVGRVVDSEIATRRELQLVIFLRRYKSTGCHEEEATSRQLGLAGGKHPGLVERKRLVHYPNARQRIWLRDSPVRVDYE